MSAAGAADIFISFVEEDAGTATQISEGLEQAGYTTWLYTRDSVGMVNFLTQEMQAISAAQAFLLLISPASVESNEVNVEVTYAHDKSKPQVPVLLGITYAEYQERRPVWALTGALAASLTIPPQGVGAIMGRLVLGLQAGGIVCSGVGGASSVPNTYPYPLAATYSRRVAAGAGKEQAFQLHHGLAYLAQAIVKYAAAIAVARYRADIGALGKDDPDVEQGLKDLGDPTPGTWLSLLNSALGLYSTSTDPLMRDLHDFFYQAKHRKDAIGEAAVLVQDWLQSSPRRKAPFSLQAVFELLEMYSDRPEGWGSQGAVLTPAEYQERLDVLRPGLEAALADLGFLVDYPLVCVRSTEPAGSGQLRLYRAMGRDMAVEVAAPLASRTWKAGHVYLCVEQAGRLEPYLDLHPLVACEDCPVCGGLALFFPAAGVDGIEYESVSCGHKLAGREALVRGNEFRAFISAESGGTLLYMDAVREVLGSSAMTEDARRNLDFLAKTLSIDPETALSVEAQVTNEFGPGSTPPVVDDVLTADLTTKVEPGRADEVSDGPPPVDDSSTPEPIPGPSGPARPFVVKWKMATQAPVSAVAMFGTPALVLAIDEEGETAVYGGSGKLVYRSRVANRCRAIEVQADRVAVTTWDGQIYVFGPKELIWQADLGSPAIATDTGSSDRAILVGTWDGRVICFDGNGSQIWATQFDDGISAMAAGPIGPGSAVGTLGGQLAIVSGKGERLWLRSMEGPLVRLAFGSKHRTVVAATRHLLIQLEVDNQTKVWERAFEQRIDDFHLHGEPARLTVATAAGLQLFAANGDLHNRGQHEVRGLKRLVPVPLPNGEQMLLGLSERAGFGFLDRGGEACLQEGPAATCAALSADGREVTLGNPEGIVSYRLARPDLKLKVAPVGELVQDRFSRIKIGLRNVGEVAAVDVGLTFEGPAECDTKDLAGEVAASGTANSEDQSIRFMAAGAVPVVAKLSYKDESGFSYEVQERHVWDVSPKGS